MEEYDEEYEAYKNVCISKGFAGKYYSFDGWREAGKPTGVKEWSAADLKENDKYYYITDTGCFCNQTLICNEDYIFKYRKAVGNCHPTKVAAEAWLKEKLAEDKK